MRRLLITGGAGFIGSNFVRYWLRSNPKDRVVNFDALTYAGNLENLADVDKNDRYRFIYGDICDADTVRSAIECENIDTIVNFAAESHVDRSILGSKAFVQTNVVGTFTLLQAAKEAWGDIDGDPRFLHVSTDEVYGTLKYGDPPFSESTAYAPNNPYAASKAASDHLVRSYHHTYGLPVVTTNCSNNYGPCQFPEKLIPLVILHALEDKDLPVYGEGKNIRDWLHVEDHCSGIEAALKSGRLGETYNIGGCNEWRNIDVVRLICSVLDEIRPGERPKSDLIRFVKDRPGHDMRYAINAKRIMSELGWKPRYSFEAGIRETILWYMDNTLWCGHVRDGEYRNYYDEQYSERV